jgi:hypothetical protein
LLSGLLDELQKPAVSRLAGLGLDYVAIFVDPALAVDVLDRRLLLGRDLCVLEEAWRLGVALKLVDDDFL